MDKKDAFGQNTDGMVQGESSNLGVNLFFCFFLIFRYFNADYTIKNELVINQFNRQCTRQTDLRTHTCTPNGSADPYIHSVLLYIPTMQEVCYQYKHNQEYEHEHGHGQER